VLSGRGLCDELITRPEESYRLCCVVVCDLETSRMGAPYIYIHDISRLRVKEMLGSEASGTPCGMPRSSLWSLFYVSLLVPGILSWGPRFLENLRTLGVGFDIWTVKPSLLIAYFATLLYGFVIIWAVSRRKARAGVNSSICTIL